MIKSDRDRTKMKKREVRLGHVRRRLLSFQEKMEVDLTNLLDQIDEDLIAVQVELEEYDAQLRADFTRADKTQNLMDPFLVLRLAQELPNSLMKARLSLGLSQTNLAKAANLKAQQINRYEQSNYESIQLSHVLALCRALEEQRQEDSKWSAKTDTQSDSQASTATGAGACSLPLPIDGAPVDCD